MSFPSAKAERLFFRSSGSARCAGKTDVFGYELELALVGAVEENDSNVSFLCPQSFVYPSADFMGGSVAQ